MGSGSPSYLKNCDLLLLCSRRKLLACTHALLFHLAGKKKKEKLGSYKRLQRRNTGSHKRLQNHEFGNINVETNCIVRLNNYSPEQPLFRPQENSSRVPGPSRNLTQNTPTPPPTPPKKAGTRYPTGSENQHAA